MIEVAVTKLAQVMMSQNLEMLTMLMVSHEKELLLMMKVNKRLI